MDAADRLLLEETVRDAIGAAVDGATDSVDVDGLLLDLGWLEMLEAEPRAATEIVFTALGATNATASVLDDVVAAGLGIAPRPDLAVLLPAFGRYPAPGEVADGRVRAAGLVTARFDAATEVLVAGPDAAVLVPVAEVAAGPRGGVDPAGGVRAATVDTTATPVTLGAGGWSPGLAAGRRAVSHQIDGACRAMLGFARDHAVERIQFGRPVAGFQAVRHRLADALVAVESTEAALGAAWDEDTPLTAALAKALAGRGARTVAANCQQVLAGIGFTTDHPFHRYMKRNLVLEGLFGSVEEITLTVGRHFREAGAVPTLLEL